MKKLFAVMLVLLCALLAGCARASAKILSQSSEQSWGNQSAGDSAKDAKQQKNDAAKLKVKDGVVSIPEKMFVTYVNEIYTNTEDYLGKTIQLEGMYKAEEYEGKVYSYVYRQGPGCCGSDGGTCGFEFTYGGETPADDDWIEVTGTLRSYEQDGLTYLTIDAGSVKVLDTRGAEIVAR